MKNLLFIFIGLVYIAVSTLLYAFGFNNTLSSVFWIVGIVILIIYLCIRAEKYNLKHNLFKFNLNEIILLIILALAFLLRIYKLDLIPLNIDGDYASHGLQVRQIIESRFSNLISFGWANIPLFGFLPSAISIYLFGDNLIGFNLINIYFGLLTIVGIYLIGREIASERIGLFAAFFCAISYVHIHFSRTAEYIDPLIPIVYGLYFFIKGIRSNNYKYIAISGIISSFGALTYFSGRILIFIIAGYSLFQINNKKHLKNILIWAFSYIIALGPYLILFIRDFASFSERTRDVFLFNPAVIEHLEFTYKTNSLVQIIIEQIKRTFLMFFTYHDRSTQFGYLGPFLDIYSVLLMIIGIFVSFATRKRKEWFIILISFVITLIVGGVFTNNATFWPRLVSLTIYTSLFAGLGIDYIYVNISKYLNNNLYKTIRYMLMLVFFMFLSFRNWNSYVKSQSNNMRYRSFIGRYIMNSKEPVYLISTDEINCKEREIEFLANKNCQEITLNTLISMPIINNPIILPQELIRSYRTIELKTGLVAKIINNPSNKSEFLIYFPLI